MVLLLMLAQASAAASALVAPAAPSGVESYDAAFFAASRPDTALDMVQRLPGFALDTGAAVRGYEGAAGNVLIDGRRPSSKTDTVDQILRRLPASQVARIDLIRGGAPGIDMQGKTVIANVVRKAAKGVQGTFLYGDLASQDGQHAWGSRLEGTGRLGAGSWDAGLLVNRGLDDGSGDGDGPLKRLDAEGQPRRLGGVHVHGFFGATTLTAAADMPLGSGQLRLNTRLYTKAFDQNETDFVRLPDTHQETEHDDDNVRLGEFGLRYARAVGPRTGVELVALRQDKTERSAADFRAPGDAALFHLDNRTAETIARAVLKAQQTQALGWEAGGEGAYNTLTSDTRVSLNGAAVALPAANVRVDERRAEVFGKAVWRPFARLTLESGVRAEASRIESRGDVVLQKSLSFTKPRFALAWAPTAHDQLRVRVEREVGQLDFTAFVASQNLVAGTLTAGNPDLAPEKDWLSEVAYERHFWGAGALILAGRRYAITDVVDRAPYGSFDAPANIGAGWKNEEEVTLTLPLDRLGLKGGQLRGDAVWRQSSVTDPTTHQPREITGLHPVDWTAHLIQDLPDLRADWGIDVTGASRSRVFRFNQIQTTKVATYLVPFVEWKPSPAVTWRFEVDNASSAGVRRTLQQYAGSRAAAPLTYVEVRDPHSTPLYHLSVRRTFGG